MNGLSKSVEVLVERAAKEENPHHVLMFAQPALSSAQALRVLIDIEIITSKEWGPLEGVEPRIP